MVSTFGAGTTFTQFMTVIKVDISVNILEFEFDGNNKLTLGVTHVKFSTEIYRNTSHKFCVKVFIQMCYLGFSNGNYKDDCFLDVTLCVLVEWCQHCSGTTMPPSSGQIMVAAGSSKMSEPVRQTILCHSPQVKRVIPKMVLGQNLQGTTQ